jgi:hypothetical protein
VSDPRRTSRTTRPRSLAVALLLILGSRSARGVDPRTALVSDVQDNSLLIEEAYNQEQGVVQNILTLEMDADGGRERDWELAFSQEWPLFSSDHQIAFTLPFEAVEPDGRASGLGDLELAYRYQLFRETEVWPAVAPSFGLSLPTGSEDRGFGNGTVGYGLSLPASKVLTDRFALNGNAGVSIAPHVAGNVLDDYLLGVSAIYAVDHSLDLFVEWVANSVQVVEDGHSQRDFLSRVSPGARYAFDLAGGQLVVALAAPIGTTPESPDWGLFVYLSFERRLWE